MRPDRNPVLCDYCKQPAQLVRGVRGHIWQCTPCDAWIPAHENSPTLKPVGRLANAELRAAKREARAALEPVIAAAPSRGKAFRWLADKLKIEARDCHIDLFDLERCQQAVAICRANTPDFGGVS